MKRFLAYSMIALAALAASACGDDEPTGPSNNNTAIFRATLLPANENPPISNAEQSGNGTATVTMNLTRDSGGQITSATADFAIALNGFPNGTTITAGHIHTGVTGVNGGVLIPIPNLASGEFVIGASGSTSFTKTGGGLTAEQANAIINNPAGFYVNVHSATNGGGFARGQMVAQ